MDILLVEDDRVSRILLERSINKRGHNVESVGSAEEALEKLKTQSYPMFFLDIGLPGMSGLDLLRLIRAEDTAPPAYVLVGTGETGEKRMSEILDAGADDYVAKPYQKSILDTRLVVAEKSVESLRERSRLEQELIFMAKHDPLTGLFNRRQLNELLLGTSHGKASVVLLQIDLDHFKQTNDYYGHQAGDQYLIEVARILGEVLSKSSRIVRLGGDEFVAVVPDLTVKEANDVAEEIISEIRKIRVDEKDSAARHGASIGITLVRADVSPEEILKQADIACYRAKSLGGSCAQVYVPFDTNLLMEVNAPVANRSEKNRLELWFQPICDLNSGEIRFHEALLRFQHAGGKPAVDAAMFMAELKRTENAANLDRFVLRQACSALTKYPDLMVSINVDATSICDLGFAGLVATELSNAQIAGDRLILEITENNTISDLSVARSVIEQLQALGVSCALDDIGTGFNSIILMKHLPIQLVKLDGELIRDLPNDHYNRSLVEALVRLADGLSFRIVGEKIEIEEEWSLARDLGIAFGQGHLIGRARRIPYEQSELHLP